MAQVTAQTASDLVPNYEVKLLLNSSKVLGKDDKLHSEVLKAFAMPDSVTKMSIQFVDNTDKAIYQSGWSLRIRKVEKKDKFELNYKKRYPISNGDIDGAVAQAAKDGFSAAGDYKPQVEWGYEKQTLSLSYEKKATDDTITGMNLPDAEVSKKMLSKKPPAELEKTGEVGINSLSVPKIFGPVHAKRSTGTWKDLEVDIEIWPIRTANGEGMENVVEASFKADDHASALQGHGALMEFLKEKGWFKPGDSLKTQLIMDRY